MLERYNFTARLCESLQEKYRSAVQVRGPRIARMRWVWAHMNTWRGRQTSILYTSTNQHLTHIDKPTSDTYRQTSILYTSANQHLIHIDKPVSYTHRQTSILYTSQFLFSSFSMYCNVQ
jgi:hypothetical protein